MPRATECFFMWQVTPTVIFGRCQDAFSEVDIDYCRSHGISFYRRKSGGGCVYADMGNIMMSYITDAASPVCDTFSRYTSLVADALKSLGIDAAVSGRNDISVNGLKVSGNAFYHTPRASIVHGTMLYHTDTQNMSRAITPSRSKLAAKGVSSVPARITTLSRHLSIPITDFIAHMRRSLCLEPDIGLTESDVQAIERLAEPYYSREWIYGTSRRRHAIRHRKHIYGVGDIELLLDTGTGGTIRHIDLFGDFFLLGDVDTLLLQPLVGVPARREALEQALSGIETSAVIRNLTPSDFINLILDTP